MNNLVVPVFIPHLGCPHQCVFCNQNEITGSATAPSKEDVRGMLAKSLGPDTPHAVIAFYGGSFTGLPKDEQEGYLRVAGGFVRQGHARGIRLSTRPDYVDEETACFLKARGVKTVELGVQSMDGEALKAAGRGHTVADSVRASGLVKSAGIELGIQIMAGLPGDARERFKRTVSEVISLSPDFVRIYPTLVIKGSPLEVLWKKGAYAPLGLDEAVGLCAEAVERFRASGIKVVRLGLQPGKELEDALLAGPYHPAFGHLVESEIALKRMLAALEESRAGRAEFRVNPSELSVYKGIRGENIGRLMAFRRGLAVSIKADEGTGKGKMKLIIP